MPTTLYFVRHGVTDWNAARRLAGRLAGVSLSGDGRREAEAVARRLAAEHPDGAVAVVSHADPIRALIARVASVPPERLRAITIDTASVSRIRRRGPRAIVDYANSRAHLEGPGACGWPSPQQSGAV